MYWDKTMKLNPDTELELLRVLSQRLACSLERWMNDGIPVDGETGVIVGEDNDSRIQTAKDRIEKRKRDNEKDRKLIDTYRAYERRKRELKRN